MNPLVFSFCFVKPKHLQEIWTYMGLGQVIGNACTRESEGSSALDELMCRMISELGTAQLFGICNQHNHSVAQGRKWGNIRCLWAKVAAVMQKQEVLQGDPQSALMLRCRSSWTGVEVGRSEPPELDAPDERR